MPTRTDLFAPSDRSSIEAATQWAAELLNGQVATIVAILAVAFVGLQMMSGRYSLKAALRVVFACFILFGSPVIAQGLIDSVRNAEPAAPLAAAVHAPPVPLPEVAPVIRANPFDPYSGAPAGQRPER